MANKAIVAVKNSPNAVKNSDKQRVLDNLSSLHLDTSNRLTVRDEDRIILKKFYDKRTFLEKAALDSEVFAGGTVIGTTALTLTGINVYAFSAWDIYAGGLVALLSVIPLIISIGVVVEFQPSLDALVDVVKRRRIYKLVQEKYSPEMASWLQNVYGITVNHRQMKQITKLVDGKTSFITEVLTDQNSKQGFKITNRQDVLVVTSEDGTEVVPGDSQNLMRANVGLKQVEPFVPTVKERKVVKQFVDEKLTNFTQKAEFLKTLNLTPESEYTIEHAEKEAAELVESLNLLKQFQDKTSLETVKNSFTLLEKELDTIMEESRKEVNNRIKVQNFYLNSRNNKGVLLTGQKNLLQKMLRG